MIAFFVHGSFACGGEESLAPQFSFSAHALECEVPGLQAWLRATGVDGVCLLNVAPDRTVSGRCRVPARAARVFRLEYTVELDNGLRILLANADLAVDLTLETREVISLDFSNAELMTDLDDDNDEVTNLVEFCQGRNPVDPNG